MAEKFLSTLLLMFISSCYFIYNTRRDTAAIFCRERIQYCNTDDTRERSSSKIQEKRNGQKKTTFNKDI